MGFAVILLSPHKHRQETITWEWLFWVRALQLVGVGCNMPWWKSWNLGCKCLSRACHGDKQASLGLGLLWLRWFNVYCFEQKKKVEFCPEWAAGGPESLSRLCFCAGTCRTGRGFFQKYLLHSPVFTITALAAAVPGVKKRGCAAAGSVQVCVHVNSCTDKQEKAPVLRCQPQLGAGSVPAAGTDVTGGIPQPCWVTSSPFWLLILNPCYVHPASDRAGLAAGSEPQPQHRHLPGVRWPVQRQPCCCRSSWVC